MNIWSLILFNNVWVSCLSFLSCLLIYDCQIIYFNKSQYWKLFHSCRSSYTHVLYSVTVLCDTTVYDSPVKIWHNFIFPVPSCNIQLSSTFKLFLSDMAKIVNVSCYNRHIKTSVALQDKVYFSIPWISLLQVDSEFQAVSLLWLFSLHKAFLVIIKKKERGRREIVF